MGKILTYDVDNDVVLQVALPDCLEMMLKVSNKLQKLHLLTVPY
jgi:hypothetical protein